jgi:cellulose biosynthesis protein BcsQ
MVQSSSANRLLSASMSTEPVVRSLAFFNNKGGVGKTTLSCNLSSLLAEKSNLSVLYVDCDPQCNATQLLLEDDVWEEIFSNKQKAVAQTVLKAFRNIRAGDSTLDTDLSVVRSERFGIDVLPGHPALSTLEDTLSTSWLAFKGGELGAARRTLWARYLIQAFSHDLVVFDVGPSLGALNRSVLLGCESFVTPMSADLFSLYALDNIADWMEAWLRDYRRAATEIGERDRQAASEWDIDEKPLISHGFRGYTVQQYVSRASQTGIRQVRAYERYKKQIPKRVKRLRRWSPNELTADLGVVPNMFAMVPLAQAAHAPIHTLASVDGLRGAQLSQQLKYAEQLDDLADRLLENLAVEG